MKKDSNLSSPARDILPLPPKTALDLKLEIQKVKESRDAIKLDNLQLALPSVCMYTFQNTNKDMSCLDFSDDCRIAAAGFQDSCIKIWSLDGSSLNNPNIALNNNDKDEDPTCKTLVGTVVQYIQQVSVRIISIYFLVLKIKPSGYGPWILTPR